MSVASASCGQLCGVESSISLPIFQLEARLGAVTVAGGGVSFAGLHLMAAQPSTSAVAHVLPWPVTIDIGSGEIAGDLALPASPAGLVIFAHGSGSSRHSSRNRAVAQSMVRAKLATLVLDLLTEAEERIDAVTAELRFDIPFLAQRVVSAIDWSSRQPRALPIGLFGASTGAAAALMAAADRPAVTRAVVSRGGRPDLAGDALRVVTAPTLLIVGGLDTQVIDLNHDALGRLTCARQLEIVPGATHLFEEPGTLEQVSDLAIAWFHEHF